MKTTSKIKDITGQKFGRLTALYRLHNTKGRTKWFCICECGNIKEVQISHLIKNNIKSCGCLRKELASKRATTHGKHDTRLYQTWCDIKKRCYNPNNKRYKDWGGRGIAVCSEWKDDFQAFYDWAINNGYDDSLTIDRIDNNKGYEPNNCRWATTKQQTRNRRNTKYITYKGESKPLAEWCEILNLNYDKVKHRINNYGWSIEKALEINS